MNKKVTAVLTLMLSMILGSILPGQARSALKDHSIQHSIERQTVRDKFINFESLINSLGIIEGMTILDIGASAGYASFLFAEKLHGTGEVFATEVRDVLVDHVAGEARQRGLTNLTSVLVKVDGLDDFYSQHRYDIVLLSNVYHCLDNRIQYFSKLREFLKPNARLVIVMYNQDHLFSEDSLSDIEAWVSNIVATYSTDTGSNPFFEELSTATRQLISAGDRGNSLRLALLEDFNRMLKNPLFYKHFYTNSYFRENFFTPPERNLANWLIMMLQEDGVFEKPADQIDARTMRTVIRLNRLFFTGQFYKSVKNWREFIPPSDANRHTSKYVMFRELDAAGYKVASETSLSTYYDAIIMVPKAP
ncbi:MAG: class I SAM-dependent methyltransferase [Candidatus Riflebacteria bacterium]|nr:class I SAM-dependent methyltransferase [Candidatus Riflebacteria bacterium]